MVRKEIIEDIIQLSEQCEKEDKEINRGKDGFICLSDIKEIPSFDDLLEKLHSLSYIEILDIESLMLLGRGDYDTIYEAVTDIRNEFKNCDNERDKAMAVEYIASKAPLHRYLRDGMKKAGFFVTSSYAQRGERVDAKYIPVIKACLNELEQEMSRLYWNKNQKELESPFQNTGAEYCDGTFSVFAYDWSEEGSDAPNFEYKGLKIWWYKHFRRSLIAEYDGTLTIDFLSDMLDNCKRSMQESYK